MAGLQVGGDWHDAFEVAGGLVGVGVGDVVGRGLAAASAMGQLRSAVRALAGSGMAPEAVLEQMDAFVMPMPGARVTAVVLATLDPADGRVRFSCAGHPPPLWIPSGRPPELLWEARARPLGVSAEHVARPAAGRGRRSPIDAVRAALLTGEPDDDACLLCLTYSGGER